jgi:hypothetical protein
VPLARQTLFHNISKSGERTMGTIDALSVDAERNDELKKAKLENGFYNIIDGERVSASKRLSVINLATGKHLATVPDVDRALLNEAISAARNFELAYELRGRFVERVMRQQEIWLAASIIVSLLIMAAAVLI